MRVHPLRRRDSHRPAVVLIAAVTLAAPVVATPAVAGAAPALSWSRAALPPPFLGASGELFSVACGGSDSCFAVGSGVDAAGVSVPLIERWQDGGWHQDAVPALPQQNQVRLNAVSCAGPSSCVAVGEGRYRAGVQLPIALKWDGASWTSLPAPFADRGFLAGIGCSADVCVAVGQDMSRPFVDTPVAVQLRDGAWHAMPLPVATGELNAVACSGGACVAVGDTSSSGFEQLALRWDGAAWTRLPLPGVPTRGDDLNAVSCVTSSYCVAAGRKASRPSAVAIDGSTTTELHPPGSPWLDAVSCSGVAVCTAMATDGSFVRYENGTWTSEPGAFDTNAIVVFSRAGLACSDDHQCVAASTVYERGADVPAAEHWSDGATWERDDLSVRPGASTSYLEAVRCPIAQQCVTVGAKPIGGLSVPIADVQVGGSWRATTLPVPPGTDGLVMPFVAFDCGAPGDCTAVYDAQLPEGGSSDYAPLVERWADGRWSAQLLDPPPGLQNLFISGVSCPAAGYCVLVGSARDGFDAHPVAGAMVDGVVRWMAVPAESDAGLRAVSCWRAGDCWAIGRSDSGNTAWRLSGGHWLLAGGMAALDGALLALSCSSATRCMAVGWYYVHPGPHPGVDFAEQLRGSTWTTVIPPVPPGGTKAEESPLSDVSCSPDGSCVAVGYWVDDVTFAFHTQAQRFDGTSWHVVQPVDDGAFIQGLGSVDCRSSTHCVAVGSASYTWTVTVPQLQLLS